MILTGNQIERNVKNGSITIEPFSSEMVNPNSYNYHLGPTLKLLDEPLDARNQGKTHEIHIPSDGIVLEPDKVYLGATAERIGSQIYVPSLIGRSSLGRLGVYLQVSADLGNLGAIHKWTLEIVVTQPTGLYAGMRCGQVSFWAPEGSIDLYHGTMARYSVPTPSIPSVLDVGAHS